MNYSEIFMVCFHTDFPKPWRRPFTMPANGASTSLLRAVSQMVRAQRASAG
jgi:hypothetical protein